MHTHITPIKTAEEIRAEKEEFFHKPFFIAPEKDIFAVRAVRLRELAPTAAEGWRDYLAFLAQAADAQQATLDALDFQAAGKHSGSTVLAPADGSFIPAGLAEVLVLWIKNVENAGTPPAAVQAAFAALRALNSEKLHALAVRTLQNTSAAEEAASAVWLSAVLQILWTQQAQHLLEEDVSVRSERAHCPCCGTEAAGAVVFSGGVLNNLRYQHCPLCNSRWNALRAKCTFCAEQSGMALQSIENPPEGALAGARAESCDVCKKYRKIFLREKQQYADPIADDLASLALDILVGENGYERGGRNPFLIAA